MGKRLFCVLCMLACVACLVSCRADGKKDAAAFAEVPQHEHAIGSGHIHTECDFGRYVTPDGEYEVRALAEDLGWSVAPDETDYGFQNGCYSLWLRMTGGRYSSLEAISPEGDRLCVRYTGASRCGLHVLDGTPISYELGVVLMSILENAGDGQGLFEQAAILAGEIPELRH